MSKFAMSKYAMSKFDEATDRAHEQTLSELVKPLKEHLATRPRLPQGREVLVLDIDGTAINDIHFTGACPPLVTIRELYEHAKRLNYEIVFLTGRKDTLLNSTIECLLQAGYPTWTELIIYPSGLPHTVEHIYAWKDEQRKRLKDDGFHLVACVGDQPMDTEGQHIGEMQLLLPRPPGRDCCIM
jgi:allantoicase